jgi:hypothetical protein
MPRPAKPFPDSIERFSKHLLKGNDATLIVLKTHLLAETEINELLELRLPDPGALYQSRFTFVQRLRILQAISRDPEMQSLVKAIESLNNLRNLLAHRLEAPDFELSAAMFIHLAFLAAYDEASRKRNEVRAPLKQDFSINSLKSASAIVVGLLARYKHQEPGVA